MPPTAPTPPEPAARHRRGIGPAVLGVVVALGTALALAGTPSAAQDGPTTTKDPVASARAALDRARVVREQADARLAAVRADKARVEKEMANLDGEDATLTTELADARRQVREFAVAAYIDGGQTELVRCEVRGEDAREFSCLNRHSKPGIYKYTVRVTDGTTEIVNDPSVVNW